MSLENGREHDIHRLMIRSSTKPADILLEFTDLTIEDLLKEAKKIYDPHNESVELHNSLLFKKGMNDFVEDFLRNAVGIKEVRQIAVKLGRDLGIWD